MTDDKTEGTTEGKTDERCQYVAGCPIYKYFRRVMEKIYRETYCEGEFFTDCQRRKLRLAGELVPDNLLPHGGKLWEDDKKKPDLWGE
ncbi:MAG: hypothetical protein JXQ72_00445 [Anaerolineae bacterium]|nr:hypothetical protein [Anaerolineae bacterium]